MKRKILLAVAAVCAATVALTGCSMPNTTADAVAVHKGGGPIEGKGDKGCVAAATKEVNGPGDEYFYYPASQITFDFTGDADSDAAPITVVSKDNQTVSIPGQINFDLNTTCKILTAFHDNIGNRYHAYGKNSEPYSEGDNNDGVRPPGWRKVLNLYIARAADSTMDRVAKGYTWRELYSDPTIKDEINKAVNETIQQLVNQQTDGDQVFFQNFATLVNQPQPSDTLLEALKAEEASKAQASAATTKAKADADTTKAKAEADASAAVAAAEAQIAQKNAELAVARIDAQKLKVQIDSYGGPTLYYKQKAIEKGINPDQPVYGGSTIVDSK